LAGEESSVGSKERGGKSASSPFFPFLRRGRRGRKKEVGPGFYYSIREKRGLGGDRGEIFILATQGKEENALLASRFHANKI